VQRLLPPVAAAASDTIEQAITTATATPVPQQPVHEQQQQQASGSFNWHQAWYPVAIVSQLNDKRPTATQLLGIDMVIWKDGSGK
jgi:phenylpropionate dioxygenase-like ring-hydroxylating dioxygenase large terminal subunit